MEPKTLPTSARWMYLVLGLSALGYALVDKFWLVDEDNLGVALPIGLMFIIMSQSDRVAAKLGSKGLVVALVLGVVALLAGVSLFFLVRG